MTPWLGLLILSHGRSGSTLLFEALSHFVAGKAAFFEPLRSSLSPKGPIALKLPSGCKEVDNDPDLENHCPLVNVRLIVNSLKCRLFENAHIYSALSEAHEVYLSSHHDKLQYNAAGHHEMGSSAASFFRNEIADKAVENERKCREHADRSGACLVKAIRVNGLLRNITHMWAQENRPFSASLDRDDIERNEQSLLKVLHLVRDPRGLVASRLSGGWGKPQGLSLRGNANRGSIDEKASADMLGTWINALCKQTMTDIESGLILQRSHGERAIALRVVRFEDMVANMSDTLHSVLEWLGSDEKKTTSSARSPSLMFAQSSLSKMHQKKSQETIADFVRRKSSNRTADNIEGHYSTAARNGTSVALSWRLKLSRWQIGVINEQCADVINAFYQDQPRS